MLALQIVCNAKSCLINTKYNLGFLKIDTLLEDYFIFWNTDIIVFHRQYYKKD